MPSHFFHVGGFAANMKEMRSFSGEAKPTPSPAEKSIRTRELQNSSILDAVPQPDGCAHGYSLLRSLGVPL